MKVTAKAFGQIQNMRQEAAEEAAKYKSKSPKEAEETEGNPSICCNTRG